MTLYFLVLDNVLKFCLRGIKAPKSGKVERTRNVLYARVNA